MNRSDNYKHHIQSRRWLNLRREKLTSNPLCEECESNGRVTSATEVHHRVPVESVPSSKAQEDLMFDLYNLMSVCHSCHVALHKELKKNTKESNIKRNDDLVEHFNNKFFG